MRSIRKICFRTVIARKRGKKQIQIEDSEIETVINNRALDRCITR